MVPMMARILRAVTLLLLLISVAWVYFWWKASALIAISGALALLLGFVPLLGIQFWVTSRVNRRDPSPDATPKQLVMAWFAEVKLTVQVFVMQQAFQENRIADHLLGAKPRVRASNEPQNELAPTSQTAPSDVDVKKQRGIVFIHGFVCNRGIWNPWMSDLISRDIPFMAINLEPVFGSIDAYAPLIERAVEAMTRNTGQPPLLICHSMGGLAARAWVRSHPDGLDRISHIVTIGTPHHGTGIVQHRIFAVNATQMQKDSPWIVTLAADEAAQMASNQLPATTGKPQDSEIRNPYAKFTCYYSNCDNIVFPASTATLMGADNRFVPGLAHLQMAFDASVMHESLARL